MVTLEQRIDKALALRRQGYNCAQCIAMTYDSALEALTAGLGTGVSATGHICGCCSAMAILTSQKSYSGTAGKSELYAKIREQIDKFAGLNQGDTDCRDLRKPGRKSCVELIKDAIIILNESL